MIDKIVIPILMKKGNDNMRKVDKSEWEKLMGEAVGKGDLKDITFLWNMYPSIQKDGYFILPF